MIPMDDATLARFLANVEVRPDGCWIWKGATSGNGYGGFSIRSRHYRAHRVSYEHFIEAIPDGLDLDHLCRVRLCVCPEHLEPVTRSENLRRGAGPELNRARGAERTHCVNGHRFTPANTVRPKDGRRRCRRCRADAQARYRAKGVTA